MNSLHSISQTVRAYGEPLHEHRQAIPTPQGSEILLRIHYCGVCHSDVHLHDGFFALGHDKTLDISTSHQLPLTLGHEIEGEIVALGPQATGKIGARYVVYPWIGCGACPVCSGGDEHLCAKPRALGVNVDGGYSNYVMVPDAHYLLNCDGIASGLAATYMCSGLTAYSALKKISVLKPNETLAVVGLGGVGMMALQFAKTLLPEAKIIVADVDDDKLQAALNAGASAAYNVSADSAAKQCLKQSGGVAAALDFVGSESSLDFAQRVVRKGGQVIVVGLFGGAFSIPIPMFPLRAISIGGSYVGSLREAKEVLELAKTGKLAAIPIQQRPLQQASQTLDDLRAGRILGRVVLNCSDKQ